jgi:exopolyphosphatase/guanosine-5'-triphosphate,3'-diphosphate pyrophosphatase
MQRYASIDVGTNTVKLTIVERDSQGGFHRVLDTSRTTRLGERMVGGRLQEVAIRRTLEALSDYAALCREEAVQEIVAVGTAALRDAVNQEEFILRAREVGVEVRPISGEQEARLSYLAVRRDPLWRDAQSLLVIDIGGGSTEFILGQPGSHDMDGRISLPIGAVRLTEAALHSNPPSIRQINDANRLAAEVLKGLTLPEENYQAVGVGGTFVNMAAVSQRSADPDPERLHGWVLTLPEIEAQIETYAARTVEQRKQIVGLDPARADIILGGAILLAQALFRCRLHAVAVSCHGLRWGLLYDRFVRDAA